MSNIAKKHFGVGGNLISKLLLTNKINHMFNMILFMES